MPAEQRGMRTRPPAVSGVFYAAGRDRLRMQVLNLLAGATSIPELTPKALIAPHAGYVYSGQVAAAAFATLQDNARAVARVVLIGPAHYVPVCGILRQKNRAPCPAAAQFSLDVLARQYATTTAEIGVIEKRIHAWHRSCEESQRLEEIPNVADKLGFLTIRLLF